MSCALPKHLGLASGISFFHFPGSNSEIWGKRFRFLLSSLPSFRTFESSKPSERLLALPRHRSSSSARLKRGIHRAPLRPMQKREDPLPKTANPFRKGMMKKSTISLPKLARVRKALPRSARNQNRPAGFQDPLPRKRGAKEALMGDSSTTRRTCVEVRVSPLNQGRRGQPDSVGRQAASVRLLDPDSCVVFSRDVKEKPAR